MIGFSDAQHCFLAKSKAYKTVGVRIRAVCQCQITTWLWRSTVAHHHFLKFSWRMAEASPCLCTAENINEHILLILTFKLIQLWKRNSRIFYCHQLHNCSAFLLPPYPAAFSLMLSSWHAACFGCIDYGTSQKRGLSVMTVENVTIMILGIPTHNHALSVLSQHHHISWNQQWGW